MGTSFKPVRLRKDFSKIERIIEGANERIEGEQQRLKEYAVNLQNHTRTYLKEHNERIIRMQEAIKYKPAVLLKNRMRSLSEAQKMFKKTIDACLINHRRKLTEHQKFIDIAHPVNTIKRGFSVTRTKDGKLLKSIHMIHPKEALITEVVDGVIDSEIKKISKSN